MKQSIYYIALLVQWDKQPVQREFGPRPPLRGTVTVECRRSIDYLDCEAWKVMGQHITTKARLKASKDDLLQAINKQYGTQFDRIRID